MKSFVTFIVFWGLFLVSSCAPIKKISGYVPLTTEIQKLVVGESTKEEIILKLGEPLVWEDHSSATLVYLQQEFETKAFFKPRVKNRVIVELIFDENSILKKVKYLDYSSANMVRMEKNIVKSTGRQLTFWQQMFGNIGNFSSEQFIQ